MRPFHWTAKPRFAHVDVDRFVFVVAHETWAVGI
jgi:hypothetical protein